MEIRRAGRPRSARADAAILRAAFELLGEVGFDGLTMEAVAERAGVGKATLYRRWSSKEALVTGVVDDFVREITIPDTGSIEGDLLHLMREAVRVYRGPAGRVVAGLVPALTRERRLATTLRASFLKPRREALRSVLERGVERGELRADLSYELALDVLGGPLFYRLLVTGGPIDASLARDVVDLMLDAWRAGDGKRETRARSIDDDFQGE